MCLVKKWKVFFVLIFTICRAPSIWEVVERMESMAYLKSGSGTMFTNKFRCPYCRSVKIIYDPCAPGEHGESRLLCDGCGFEGLVSRFEDVEEVYGSDPSN